MNIFEATRRYERWLGAESVVLNADIRRKHEEMKAGPFQFFRATYYRWVQIWEEAAGDLAKTPRILSVGDLHIENFGTWRDAEGRLVWGINDFDEAAELPMANDLLRLAVSAVLAATPRGLALSPKRIAKTILRGYIEGIESGGCPFVLEERHPTLRAISQLRLKNAESFWKKLGDLSAFKGEKPKAARRFLKELLPKGVKSVRIGHRDAGLGSLGRQRLTAIGELDGGYIAREVKQLVPAGSFWATGRGSRRIPYSTIVNSAVRCHDPFLAQRGAWIGRRLSPSNSRIELAELPPGATVAKVLHSMGFETANVHLGNRHHKRLKKAAKSVKESVFNATVQTLAKAVFRDWKDWSQRKG